MTYSIVFGAAADNATFNVSIILQCVPLGVLEGEDVAAMLIILILAF